MIVDDLRIYMYEIYIRTVFILRNSIGDAGFKHCYSENIDYEMCTFGVIAAAATATATGRTVQLSQWASAALGCSYLHASHRELAYGTNKKSDK